MPFTANKPKPSRSIATRKPASALPFSKKQAKPNASILSFFQKTQRPEESLFVGASVAAAFKDDRDEIRDRRDDECRFNEAGSPVKKRRLGCESSAAAGVSDAAVAEGGSPGGFARRVGTVGTVAKTRVRVPFVIDSDSESEDEKLLVHGKKEDEKQHETHGAEDENQHETHGKREDEKQHETHGAKDVDSVEEFEGEEMRERRFTREQARLEAEQVGAETLDDFGDDSFHDDSAAAECCPICNGSLRNVSMDEATRHVNSCLDGNPVPLPMPDAAPQTPMPSRSVEAAAEKSKPSAHSAAAVPRPGQANPFDHPGRNSGDSQDGGGGGGGADSSKSAFSKLMSSKAEDGAWAVAAATENASRGRRAHERTCPFYKIIPGFNICVDAFRYGAVQGCEAYFLSHFHSDHYIGLTANWTHGPIYCSRVTGSLVKKQLRTAARWVVELEFEKTYDVPGTGGATVTMIPANHCPGSSLFLFEKPAERGGAGANPNRRAKRILHCGDFRACPAHVGHPLLKPDVMDMATGRLSQQVIDICYLDTTYLNPKYSFPPQNDVIRACVDLCASLSPDPDGVDGDPWEKRAKGEEGTQAMSRYFARSTKQNDKDDDKDDDDDDDDATTTATNKARKAKQRKNKPGQQRLLVVCGTYSIGKERICIAVAKALKTKIFANPGKMRICKQLDDAELAALLTSDPLEAQVHMQPLAEIRAETLQEYLNGHKPHFSRVVGFRPTGWTFRPPSGKPMTANTSPSSISTQELLHGKGWRTRFACGDFVPQRGSTRESMCFGVPYSEHSSFRELAMFVMCLRIEKVIPTVNIGSEVSRRRMKAWLDRWAGERRRGGLARPLVEEEEEEGDNRYRLDEVGMTLWDDKSGKGGGVWW